MRWVYSFRQSDIQDLKDKADDLAIRKFFTPLIKGVNEKARTVDFMISTKSVDRDGDTIDPKGWNLKAYKANPVVMWAHDYSLPPIGKAVKIGTTAEGLRSRAQFMDAEMNPFAETIFQMLKEGFLQAASVGFRPLKDGAIFNEERHGIDFVKQELLEWSVVPVPANADAVVVDGIKAKGINVKPILEWGEKWLEEDDHDEAERQAVEMYCRALDRVSVAAGEIPPEPEDLDHSWKDEHPEIPDGTEAKGEEALLSSGSEHDQSGSSTGPPKTGGQVPLSGTITETSTIEWEQEKDAVPVPDPKTQRCHGCQQEFDHDHVFEMADTDEPKTIFLCATCVYSWFPVKEPDDRLLEVIDDEIERLGVDEATFRECMKQFYYQSVQAVIHEEVEKAMAYVTGRVL